MGAGFGWRRHVPPGLFLIAVTMLLFAASRPLALVSLPADHSTIVLAIDVSLSMRATDVKPNRMVAAQEAGADFTGVFAGYPGWLNGEFRSALATAVARGHSLLLHESVTNAELRGLYQAAAFTIYASLDEGFGLPIIESLRHGRPCITSDRGSMREIADLTGGCLLIDPEDTADMATAIAGLFKVPEDLARLTLEAEQAEWPDWREYTEQLVRFATRPAATLKIRQRPAA